MTTTTPPRLYHYWRSTSSWRVRFAFAHKGIEAELIPVNLLADEADAPAHLARNPMGHVPVLELPAKESSPPRFIGESLAILEWAEETHPDLPLLPRDPWRRARARQLAELINSGTQPLINLGVAQRHSDDPAAQKAWNQHWIRKGLGAFEALASETAGRYCLGEELTLADICLAPQCYSAARNEVPLAEFPTLARINARLLELEACQRSHPDRFAPPTAK